MYFKYDFQFSILENENCMLTIIRIYSSIDYKIEKNFIQQQLFVLVQLNNTIFYPFITCFCVTLQLKISKTKKDFRIFYFNKFCKLQKKKIQLNFRKIIIIMPNIKMSSFTFLSTPVFSFIITFSTYLFYFIYSIGKMTVVEQFSNAMAILV